MAEHPSTSIRLLTAAQDGVDEAFAELRALYTPLVYFWCRESRVRAGDAEEIWSNLFGAVAESLPKFEHNGRKGAFRKWLKRITANEIADFYKGPDQGQGGTDGQDSLRHLPDREEDQQQQTQETSILYRAAWQLVQSQFSSRDNEVFRRVAEHGERPKDVAQDMNLKPSTVYTLIHRIKTRLLERFAGLLDQ